jgi:protein-S-isoprenylcysteine O-methyltransferase Ste14
MLQRLARVRVPLGFLAAAVALWWAQPTSASLLLGLAVALVGEALRIWAAGHIEKGREITTSGPYRFVRHPLYLGSAIIGVGFAAASRSWVVTGIVLVYLALTYVAAIRTEEATLDARFDGKYTAYREGRLEAAGRRFQLARARANREYRAVIGLTVGALILFARMQG